MFLAPLFEAPSILPTAWNPTCSILGDFARMLPIRFADAPYFDVELIWSVICIVVWAPFASRNFTIFSRSLLDRFPIVMSGMSLLFKLIVKPTVIGVAFGLDLLSWRPDSTHYSACRGPFQLAATALFDQSSKNKFQLFSLSHPSDSLALVWTSAP